MTTSILPSSGAGVLFTQQGTGTTPGYAALDGRRASNGALQEGVFGTSTLVTAGGVASVAAADFMVTQRGAGANMSVDINMPAGGFAYVQGDTVNGQGLYTVPVHSANINEAIAAADATNPRVDQVILEIQDNVLDASGGNLARTRVLTGTPSGSASLASRAGAAVLPGSALLLADVLVPASAANVPNTGIRDRRKFARGAFLEQLITTGNPTTSSASFVGVSGVVRLECSGVPVRVTLSLLGSNSGAAYATSGLLVDAASVGTLGQSFGTNIQETGYAYTFIPTAGSHTFQPAIEAPSGGTATFNATASVPMAFIVEELVRQNVANNTVTSG